MLCANKEAGQMLQQILDYCRHRLQCKSVYSLHSPFVFDWYNQVLKAPRSEVGKEIERFRKELKHGKRMIELTDYGAGSGNKGSTQQVQRLGKLVAKASRKRASGELLYQLCKYHQPKRCLEFGTHVGISSLYQLKGLSHNQFLTLEGDPNLAAIAAENFQIFGVQPRQLVGEFGELLKHEVGLEEYQPDYVFIDGNHKYVPTLQYFHQVLPHIPDEGIIIFDDIYWSAEMKKAWTEIIQHPEVSVSIDLFFLGICYIRRKQAKEHFKLRL